jgi:hypothetical protein
MTATTWRRSAPTVTSLALTPLGINAVSVPAEPPLLTCAGLVTVAALGATLDVDSSGRVALGMDSSGGATVAVTTGDGAEGRSVMVASGAGSADAVSAARFTPRGDRCK